MDIQSAGLRNEFFSAAFVNIGFLCESPVKLHGLRTSLIRLARVLIQFRVCLYQCCTCNRANCYLAEVVAEPLNATTLTRQRPVSMSAYGAGSGTGVTTLLIHWA